MHASQSINPRHIRKQIIRRQERIQRLNRGFAELDYAARDWSREEVKRELNEIALLQHELGR